MSIRSKQTRRLGPTLLAVLVFTGGSFMAQSAQSAPGPGMGGGMAQPGGAMQGGMQGKGRHRQAMQGCGHAKHGKRHGKRGRTSCGKHLFGGCWKHSLNAEQKARLDRLHINHARIKAPIKARIKALKVDLAILATTTEPDKAVIDAKIAELLEFKGESMGAKYGYIAAQRQVLTPAQQVSFDMEQIHGAMHGKMHGKMGKGGGGARH